MAAAASSDHVAAQPPFIKDKWYKIQSRPDTPDGVSRTWIGKYKYTATSPAGRTFNFGWPIYDQARDYMRSADGSISIAESKLPNYLITYLAHQPEGDFGKKLTLSGGKRRKTRRAHSSKLGKTVRSTRARKMSRKHRR